MGAKTKTSFAGKTPCALRLSQSTSMAQLNLPSSGTGKWKVTYFDAPNRGEQLRMLLTYAEIDFEDERLQGKFPASLDPLRRATMGDDTPLMFDQVPIITSPEGTSVSQVAACMQYAGKRLGLEAKGSNPAELDARALALTLRAEEIRNKVFYGCFKPLIVDKVLKMKLGACASVCCCLKSCFGTSDSKLRKTASLLPPMVQNLEANLRTNGGSGVYFCGDSVCYADIAIFEVLLGCFGFNCFDENSLLSNCPKLRTFMSKMREQPTLQNYLAKRPANIPEFFAEKMFGSKAKTAPN